MVWTFDERSPIYSQIVQEIKLQIVSYQIKSGEQLPTVRDFAEKAGVNPNTMQRAFTELEREGLVYTKRTSGRFVTDDQELIDQKRHELAANEIATFIKKMLTLGFSEKDIISEIKAYLKETKG
ncbi:GntR family transcriptional regulator [Streptococcus sp. E17BB]|uniref:GntR family transcriptional regulator n=1 Tax=Streptococcus sp. E17BB TaxID=3278714 RepID=UPI00359DEC8D